MSVFCTDCGASVEPGKKFCASCGAKVEPASAGEGRLPPAAPPRQQAPAIPVPPRPMATSGRTVALYDQDPTSAQPFARPEQPPAFAPKKQAVYPQQNVDSQYPPGSGPYPAAAAVPPMPPRGHSEMSMPAYLIHLLVMSLPVIGLVMSIIWCGKPDPPAKSNLAKAMIVFNVIWYIVFVIFIYLLYSVLSQAVDISFNFGF